jgi:hypothetical protein
MAQRGVQLLKVDCDLIIIVPSTYPGILGSDMGWGKSINTAARRLRER